MADPIKVQSAHTQQFMAVQQDMPGTVEPMPGQRISYNPGDWLIYERTEDDQLGGMVGWCLDAEMWERYQEVQTAAPRISKSKAKVATKDSYPVGSAPADEAEGHEPPAEA